MKGTTLRTLRRLHLYAGIFFAPAIIFFSFSGMLQVYSFHEAEAGEAQPPAWIVTIASLHKNQRFARPPQPVAAPEHDRPPPAAMPPKPVDRPGDIAALKLFSALMGLGLIAAALLGIAVALGTRSTRRLSAVSLALGVLVPVVMLAL